eukprot:1110182-Prorocentrum_lima.AAC.1
MEGALTLVIRYLEGLQQASDYFGLLNRNGAWILPESARRHFQLYSCLLCVAHSTLHLFLAALARASAR